MIAINPASPVWFITGCSRGLGWELSRLLLARGAKVILTARNLERIAALASDYPETSLALEIDVTVQQQIEAAVEAGERRFGRIDILVNNAGYAYLAAIEEGEERDIREMFEVNFFGLAAVTRTILPGMRMRGSGHIINVGSIAGTFGLPSGGYYSASKFAVEGFSEALALEVRPLGIRVTVIEPGAFRTEFASSKSLRVTRTPIPAYDGTAGARRKTISGSNGKQPGDPARFADAVIQIVNSDRPPANLLLGRIAFEQARKKYLDRIASADSWKVTSRGVDFESHSNDIEFARK